MAKNMKTVGVIGGFGPEATAKFYLKLVTECRKVTNGQQPHVIVWNVSVPKILEHAALADGADIDKFIPLVTHAAQSLERAGAEIIVLPCNTLHVLVGAIRHVVRIPFVSIIESSVIALRRQKTTRIGLLGSRVTVNQNLFKRASPNLTFVTVDDQRQSIIDQSLYHFVATHDPVPLSATLNDACRALQHQPVSDILVACTDFHCLCPDLPGVRLHDTLNILVNATVRAASGNEKKNMV